MIQMTLFRKIYLPLIPLWITVMPYGTVRKNIPRIELNGPSA